MAKFLIIRFSSIGDIVLTTPVIRAIKQQIPVRVDDATIKKLKQLAIRENRTLSNLVDTILREHVNNKRSKK